MSRRPGLVVGGGALLVVAGAAILFSSTAMAGGQAGPSLTFTPPSQQMMPSGGEFNIDVRVSNVQNLGAYDLTVIFDPNVVEYIGSQDNGFLASTGRDQTCFGYGQSPATVNGYKALHAGCATNGLIDGGQGDPGPNGSASLATLVFKPKAIGQSDILFEGVGTDNYYVGAPDPELPAGAVEIGHTALAFVEECDNGACDSALDIPFAFGTGIVTVLNPNAPTPTALAPTSTPVPPDDVPEEEFRKTVEAAVGTPGHTLATPGASGTQTGAAAGTDGSGSTTGGGVTSSSAGGSSAGGAVPAGAGYPPGTTIGPDGIPRGPDGVPIAGYGMEAQGGPNPIWMWAGLTVLAAGALTLAYGLAVRRTAA